METQTNILTPSQSVIIPASFLSPKTAGGPLEVLFALSFGMAMTLCVRGYQFGQSNHTIYLIDALRKSSPQLLAHDWFTTSTLQYHSIFGWLTQTLMRWEILEPAFLFIYLALVFLMHLAWYRLVICLGGRREIYLISVLIYYISAGGTGLGMYQFMQDSALLPSNLANVGMLGGIYYWIRGRPGWAGVCLGIAGLLHLNFSVVGIGLWSVLISCKVWDARVSWRGLQATGFCWGSSADSSRREQAAPLSSNRKFWSHAIGTIAVAGLSMVNIIPALRAIAGREGGLPLGEFVDLYVRLRHPHHYDPSSWPSILWLSFLWPIPLAVIAYRQLQTRREAIPSRRLNPSEDSLRQTSRIFLFFIALQMISLLFAGWWYISETLIQMSLYRFSIFPKLLSCIGAAYFLCDNKFLSQRLARPFAVAAIPILIVLGITVFFSDQIVLIHAYRGPIIVFLILCLILAVYRIASRVFAERQRQIIHFAGIILILALLVISWNRQLGFNPIPRDDADYLAACQWISDPANTPVDAVFLVPPQEQTFRLHAQRAIVVNFKAVPQLGAELPIWRDRLQDVLELNDLRSLPTPFDQTLEAIRRRYETRSTKYLLEVAHHYNARYILIGRRLDPNQEHRLVYPTHGNGSYFLYDLK